MNYTEKELKYYKLLITTNVFKHKVYFEYREKLVKDIEKDKSISQYMIIDTIRKKNILKNIFQVYRGLYQLGAIGLKDEYKEGLTTLITNMYTENKRICTSLSRCMIMAHSDTITDYIYYLLTVSSLSDNDEYFIGIVISEIFKKTISYDDLLDIILKVVEEIYTVIFNYPADNKYFSLNTLIDNSFKLDIETFNRNVRFTPDIDKLYDILYKISLPDFLSDDDDYYELLYTLNRNYKHKPIVF